MASTGTYVLATIAAVVAVLAGYVFVYVHPPNAWLVRRNTDSITFFSFGIPPQLKRQMEEKALETMGENKASYMMKDTIGKMPASDQKVRGFSTMSERACIDAGCRKSRICRMAWVMPSAAACKVCPSMFTRPSMNGISTDPCALSSRPTRQVRRQHGGRRNQRLYWPLKEMQKQVSVTLGVTRARSISFPVLTEIF